jgi:DNA polymerase-3 subunit gamma/tau
VNELAQSGKDLGRLLSDLLNHFRNLLIFQVSRGDLNLLEVSEAEIAALKEQSGPASTESLTRILEVFTDAELRLRDTASKKILIEVTMLKAIEARQAVSLDSILKQLNQLRGGGTGLPAPAVPVERRAPARLESPTPKTVQQLAGPGAPVASTEAPAQSRAAAPAEAPPTADDLAGLWTRLIEAVGRVSPFTRSYLVDAQPVSFAKNIFTIGFDPEFEDHLGLVDNARNHTLLQTKLAELGHANAQIKFIKAEASATQVAKAVAPAPAASALPPAAPASAKPAAAAPAREKSASVPFNKADFKNDPLIQKALEIFKGQIVEVRA